jgi:hypothetical protein
MSAQPLPAPAADVPPVVAALREAINDLIDDAGEAAARMRGGVDAAYRIGQAERAIAMHEAAASVRAVLDTALDEGAARP